MSAIGIDLGTTNSCVAAIKEGRVEVFENDIGNLVTPSCVCFTKGKPLIGEPARRLMTQEPENTIYSIKRIIGRKLGDQMVQEDIRRWWFKVDGFENGRPLIIIDHRQETYCAEEISGLVLDYMRRIACKRLDEDVRDAVVTVPAYFNHMQRTATKTAAELAGLNVLGIINEPTAAAIDFGLVKKHSENRNILIYDFGGGTLDVTVLSICGSEFTVRASSGNNRLGGDDLTNGLMDHLIEYIRIEMEEDITTDKLTMAKLLEECEKAKKELSFRFEYTVHVENIVGGRSLKKSINRAKFISIIKDLLDKTMDYVKDAIEQSGMEKEDIQFVVSVGGSSRIPFVKEKLKNYFGKDKIKADRNPEQAIARGAAIYAAHLKGDSIPQISEIYLYEVTPLSLGIKEISRQARVIISRNTKLPVVQNKIQCNSYDGQRSVTLPVCQGEEEQFKNNEYLGEFKLKISPKRKGKVKINVEFRLDVDGVLHATATEIGVGRSESTEIDLCGTLEKLDTQELKEKLKKLTSADEEEIFLNEAKDELEFIINEIKQRHEHDPQVIRKCDEILQWLANDPSATMLAIQQRKEEIEKIMGKINLSWSLEFLS